MIKEAIQYIVSLGNTRLENINGQSYSTQQMYLAKEPTPAELEVRSLSGLVEYLKSHFDGDEKVMVQVINPVKVQAFSSFNNDFNRKEFINAVAMLPQFTFDRFHDTEDFNIKLQSAFVQNNDRDIMLKVVGNIKEEAVNTIGDDGVSQSVVAKTGVATVSQVKVPNPVQLAPYRTFVEVEQPTSNFIFRMKNGPQAALYEADGGAWKLEAMKNIQTYLADQLKEEIEAGRIVVIA
ncbi:hypothetical protein CN692_25485 [Bacillus sp. AFS002410]|uniref:hypothetical protein n=1 Tax=Bacillus sp. AFS002410 TaxID=2033481 RepID=UPI000BF07952|nr:hypothetical protein [Bacillus sp. AFS002410]PEJ46939.1 hypothetical protein CN692_25485 [Bacillus sp. AFS002410]